MLFTGHYIYRGINSSRYHLLFANLDTDRLSQICNNIEYFTEYYKGFQSHEIHGWKWAENPMSFEVEILSETPIDNIQSKKDKKVDV